MVGVTTILFFVEYLYRNMAVVTRNMADNEMYKKVRIITKKK